ncbi:MAG: hypothetical protein A3F12_01730 [Gammaproteobacteria bacterium RIFCSPHIGHO2_12_FULL_38_14]|nr:MAG: hypothetical protein A3F12_01730 [Gammaproteobacteria bacterium RIFCSPHIGHO2_12_FULL_38_14]
MLASFAFGGLQSYRHAPNRVSSEYYSNQVSQAAGEHIEQGLLGMASGAMSYVIASNLITTAGLFKKPNWASATLGVAGGCIPQ